MPVKPIPVRPYDPGPNAVVQPLQGPYHLGGEELRLQDTWAQEQVRTSGTRVLYYSLNVEASTTNPVYDESTNRVYDGPFDVQGFIEWPKSNPDTRESGLVVKWNTRAWIPRAEFERARCPLPLEGDVLRVWRTPFFDTWGVSGDEPQEGGYCFTVIQSNDEGHLFDDPAFVGFEFQVERNTDFTPERRLDNLRR